MDKTQQLADDMFKMVMEVKSNPLTGFCFLPLPNEFFIQAKALDDGKGTPLPRVSLEICDSNKIPFEHVETVTVENDWNNQTPSEFVMLSFFVLNKVNEIPKEQKWMEALGFKGGYKQYQLTFPDQWWFKVEKWVGWGKEIYYTDSGYPGYRERKVGRVKILFKHPDFPLPEFYEINPKEKSLTECLPFLMYGVMKKAWKVSRIEFLNHVPKQLINQAVSSSLHEELVDVVNEYGDVVAERVLVDEARMKGSLISTCQHADVRLVKV